MLLLLCRTAQTPEQLLAVYKQLEESNLFYIQNAQETEEALEELRQKLRDTKARMDAEAAGLQVSVHMRACAQALAPCRKSAVVPSADAMPMACPREGTPWSTCAWGWRPWGDAG